MGPATVSMLCAAHRLKNPLFVADTNIYHSDNLLDIYIHIV